MSSNHIACNKKSCPKVLERVFQCECFGSLDLILILVSNYVIFFWLAVTLLRKPNSVMDWGTMASNAIVNVNVNVNFNYGLFYTGLFFRNIQ